MRNAIRHHLKRLKGNGVCLQALYKSMDQSFFDVENVLFYNVGQSSFNHLNIKSLQFERAYEYPFTVNGHHFEHYQSYKIVDQDEPISQLMGITTFGDMPADPNYPLSEDMKNRVMHAHLKVGEADLMFSDTYEGMPYQPGNTIQIAIHLKEEARAREIFTALEDGGQVVIPLHKTDWSPLFGMIKDKFGVNFNVNVAVEQQ